MTNFPKIKGLEWVSENYPDLVIINVALESTAHVELGIRNFVPEQMVTTYHLDLSRLAGIRNWYEKGEDEASETECLADFSGVNSLVLTIEKKELIKAWMFYKKYIYDHRNI